MRPRGICCGTSRRRGSPSGTETRSRPYGRRRTPSPRETNGSAPFTPWGGRTRPTIEVGSLDSSLGRSQPGWRRFAESGPATLARPGTGARTCWGSRTGSIGSFALGTRIARSAAKWSWNAWRLSAGVSHCRRPTCCGDSSTCGRAISFCWWRKQIS